MEEKKKRDLYDFVEFVRTKDSGTPVRTNTTRYVKQKNARNETFVLLAIRRLSKRGKPKR